MRTGKCVFRLNRQRREVRVIPGFHALLIGVNCCLPNLLPGGGTYRILNGCVRDITHVEAYLRTALGVPTDCITRLTSTWRHWP